MINSGAAKIGPAGAYSADQIAAEGATEVIGRLLFTEYVLHFEIVSILLLVSIIGAVVLAKRYVQADEKESA